PQDPRTGQFFPNFVIPKDRLDPVAVRFAAGVMPLPNSGSSYIFNGPSSGPNDKLDETQLIGRIDHSFSAKDTIFGRYYYNNDTGFGLTSTIPTHTFIKRFRNKNLVLNRTRGFNTRMLNTAMLGFSRLWHRGGIDQGVGGGFLGGQMGRAHFCSPVIS